MDDSTFYALAAAVAALVLWCVSNVHLVVQARRLRADYRAQVAGVKEEVQARTATIQGEVTGGLKTWLMSPDADPYIERVAVGAAAAIPDVKAEFEAAIAPLREKVDRWEREGLPLPEVLMDDAQLVKLADIFWERTAALSQMEEGRARLLAAFQPVADSIEARRMAHLKAMQEKFDKTMEAGGDVTMADLAEFGSELGLTKRQSAFASRLVMPYIAQSFNAGYQKGLAPAAQRKLLGPGANGGDPFR